MITMGTARKFVQLIEKYPCLYNTNLAEYARKDITESAWKEVAVKMGCAVHECKDKWKNIRNGFVRSLKPHLGSSSGKQKKQYYLYDEMQFVLPYVRPQVSAEDLAENIHNRILPIEYVDTPDESVDVDNNTVDGNYSESASEDDGPEVKRAKMKMEPEMNEAEAIVEWLRNKTSYEDDPRKMFLLSLLPDIHQLTDDQMRAFRIKILMLLEEIKK